MKVIELIVWVGFAKHQRLLHSFISQSSIKPCKCLQMQISLQIFFIKKYIRNTQKYKHKRNDQYRCFIAKNNFVDNFIYISSKHIFVQI